MAGVINRGVILFMIIVVLIFGFILFFQSVNITGFAIADQQAIYYLREGRNIINANVNTDSVVINGLSGEIIKRNNLYALYTKEISANNLGLIELYKEDNALKGQIVSRVDNNIAVINGQSYRLNLNENIVLECSNKVCLTCINCALNR